MSDKQQVTDQAHTEKGLTQYMGPKPLQILIGVPKRSVLGPVLLIIFTNPNYLDEYAMTIMYADHTTLLLSDSTPNNLEVSAHIALLFRH